MLTIQDIICSEDKLLEYVSARLVTGRDYGSLVATDKSSLKFHAKHDLESWPREDATKYLLAFAKHKQKVVERIPEFILELANNPSSVIGSEDSKWNNTWVNEYYGLKSMLNKDIFEQVDVRITPGIQQVIDFWFEPRADSTDSKVIYAWIGKEYNSEPLLRRAWLEARYSLLLNSNYWFSTRFAVNKQGDSFVLNGKYVIDLLALHAYWSILKPTRMNVLQQRNNILKEQARKEAEANANRSSSSQDNFKTYWEGMKVRVQQLVDEHEVKSAFETIPILPAGTASSRTWGIEVEVVQNKLVKSRPRGWDERYDGSLESYNDDGCGCDCEDCSEYDSCCGYDECDSNDTAEYVSPILHSFNSAGLRSLCSDLDGSDVNTTPGIHIHVGADNLNVVDVSRLVVAYSAVSPFLWALTGREYRGYCKDISTSNLAYWLAQARDLNKRGALNGRIDYNSSLSNKYAYQPDDRYHDLNLQSIGAHGTIEFRAMGPIYNYKHLVRWAWLCRELVNVSRLDLPQSTWTSVRSMADVIKILRTYGAEQLPAKVDKLYDEGDTLSTELKQETDGEF
jgi:hypothetical protein